MANEEKKFLDQEGVKYLWSKISMQDYPNNSTLAAVIEAIDETKADKDELVQADWNETDETSLAFIKNKPEIAADGGVTVQSDWTQEDTTAADYIKNKPEIPSIEGLASTEYVDEAIAGVEFEQIQANWSQTDGTQPDYIRNKPSIPSISGLATNAELDTKISDSTADYSQIVPWASSYIKNKLMGYKSGYELIDYTFTELAPVGATVTSVNYPSESINSYLTAGDTLEVIWDGKSYSLTVYGYIRNDNPISYAAGSPAVLKEYYSVHYSTITNTFTFPDGEPVEYDSLPFCLNIGTFSIEYLTKGTGTEHTISFYSPSHVTKALLDEEWIDSSVARKSYVTNSINEALNSYAASAMPNWDESDINASSYIHNRPFGYLPDCYNDLVLNFIDTINNLKFQYLDAPIHLNDYEEEIYCNESTEFLFTWDGTEYTLTPKFYDFSLPLNTGTIGIKGYYIGNPYIVQSEGAVLDQVYEDNGLPFFFSIKGGFVFLVQNSTELEHTISLKLKDNYRKIKESDLPDNIINVQSDWAQEDSTQSDYIKNKPDLEAMQNDINSKATIQIITWGEDD